jgi:hypothetical protein
LSELNHEELKEIIREIDDEKDSRYRWLSHLAISIAFMALFTTIADTFSDKLNGDSAGLKADSVLLRNEATNHWTYYQAKVLREKMYDIANSLEQRKKFQEKIEQYRAEKADIRKKAEKLDTESRTKSDLSDKMYKAHRTFAFSIGFFQTGIAIASVASLTHSRRTWYGSIGVALFGLGVVIYGMISMVLLGIPLW